VSAVNGPNDGSLGTDAVNHVIQQMAAYTTGAESGLIASAENNNNPNMMNLVASHLS